MLLARGRVDEAIEEFWRAIELRPGYAEAMNNLGVALARSERFDEAVYTLRQTLASRPDWNELLSNLGSILRAQGRLDEAADCYRRIVDLAPSVPKSHNLYGTMLAVAGRLDEALVHFKEALRLQPAYQTAHSNLLLARGHEPSVDPQTLFAEHRFYDLMHGRGMSPAPAHQNDRMPNRRLQVGYVSPDFRKVGATIEYANGSPTSTAPEGELVENILAAFAADERARIRYRLRKWAAKKKAKSEWMGRPPIGWQLDLEDSTQLIEHATERQAIARACDLKQNGYHSAEIANIFSDEFGLCSGNPWSDRTVRRLVRKYAR